MKKEKQEELKTQETKANETEQFVDINEVLKAFDDIKKWFDNLDWLYSEMDKEEREEENYELEEQTEPAQ